MRAGLFLLPAEAPAGSAITVPPLQLALTVFNVESIACWKVHGGPHLMCRGTAMNTLYPSLTLGCMGLEVAHLALVFWKRDSWKPGKASVLVGQTHCWDPAHST